MDDLSFALAVLLLLPGIGAVLRRRDAWPYSWYPMYSTYLTLERVAVYRLALENASGEVCTWEPRHPRLQEILGTQFERLLAIPDPGQRAAAERQFLVEATLLVLRDNPPEGRLVALRVIRRTLRPDNARSPGSWRVVEETVRGYPLAAGGSRAPEAFPRRPLSS